MFLKKPLWALIFAFLALETCSIVALTALPFRANKQQPLSLSLQLAMQAGRTMPAESAVLQHPYLGPNPTPEEVAAYLKSLDEGPVVPLLVWHPKGGKPALLYLLIGGLVVQAVWALLLWFIDRQSRHSDFGRRWLTLLAVGVLAGVSLGVPLVLEYGFPASFWGYHALEWGLPHLIASALIAQSDRELALDWNLDE